MAKLLFIFLFFFFSFRLTIHKKCGKVSCHKCHTNHSHIIVMASCHIMSYDESHDGCGKIVHRPYSSCISSLENLMGTPLSFSC